MENELPDSGLLENVFHLFFDYVSGIVGRKKSLELALKSKASISQYFRNMSNFEVSEKGELSFTAEEVGDKDVLAFSIWLQQFLKELKEIVTGIGHFDAGELTVELEPELRKLGFYEYFDSASELRYS